MHTHLNCIYHIVGTFLCVCMCVCVCVWGGGGGGGGNFCSQVSIHEKLASEKEVYL